LKGGDTMKKNEQNDLVTIRLPGNDFPYNHCTIEEGDPSDLSNKLVFTTISKAGVERRITIHPNGTVIENVLSPIEDYDK